MRVLLAHNIAPWDPRAGGGQRVQHQIASALADLGHDVRALFLGPPIPPAESVSYRWTQVPEHPRLMNNVLAMARATAELSADWIPDVAYLSSPESAGSLMALPGRTGTLMTSHHPELPELPPPSWRFGRTLRDLRRLQAFHLERWVLRRVHRRTAVSAYGRAMLVERRYVDRGADVTVIHNALDPYWLSDPCRAGIPESRRSGFLFVGRMDDQKGVDVLLEAYAGIDTQWPLTLIGDGWRRSELEARARNLGLGGRVSFVGYRGRQYVRKAMEDAGALVAPSRSENYPMVLLEAMATELPVVATRVGGIPEMVTHPASGLLVAPGDADGLREAMKAVFRDPDLRRRLAVAGRTVADRHALPRTIGAIEAELLEAAHLGRRAPSNSASPLPPPRGRPLGSPAPSSPM